MKVVIAGSGNVATVLGKLILSKGHEIIQVISRNEANAKALAEKLGCSSGDFKSSKFKDADLYIFALTDTALYHLDREIHLGKKLAVHTAGSVSKDVLKNISGNYGVIYPLQTLTKNTEILADIPLMTDGNNAAASDSILKFASTISDDVSVADDEKRLKFHIAAVLVSNFTNHLFAVADDFCKKEGIDFQKLYPLIQQTILRIKDHSPLSVQTGPAIREDIYTMGKHLQVLSAYPELKYIYIKLSESILKLHQAR